MTVLTHEWWVRDEGIGALRDLVGDEDGVARIDERGYARLDLHAVNEQLKQPLVACGIRYDVTASTSGYDQPPSCPLPLNVAGQLYQSASKPAASTMFQYTCANACAAL